MRTKTVLVACTATFFAAAALPTARIRETPSARAPVAAPARVHRGGGVDVPFVEDRSAADTPFRAATFAGGVGVRRDGAVDYALATRGADATHVVERLVTGAALDVAGAEPSPTRVAQFRGRDPACRRSDLPTWRSVVVSTRDADVTLELRASARNVEKVFRLAPGAAVESVRMHVEGACALRVAGDGSLDVATAAGSFAFTAPVAYQDRADGRVAVDVAYVTDGTEYGFRAGAYDRSLPLVIDPLIASTFLGGASEDWCEDIAAYWANGDVYVVGSTAAADFGIPDGGFHGGARDAFVARLDANLETLLGFAILGGSDDDLGLGITVESRGVFVVGETRSLDMPATDGAYGISHHGGLTDGWIAKLPLDLQGLEAFTYHGGSGPDRLSCVAASGGLRVAGETRSTDLWFPDRAFQKLPGGSVDLLFATPREDLTEITFQSLLGGSSSETLEDIVTFEGTVAAVGHTYSYDFPTTETAFSDTRRGEGDAFVLTFREDYSELLGSTLLGGAAEVSEDESATGVALATVGELLVCGYSNAYDFPTTEGAYDHAPAPYGSTKAWVCRITEDCSTLVASTLFGGTSGDAARAVVADPHGLVVVGTTSSSDFPAETSLVDPTFNGGSDVFAARFPPALDTLEAATFLGGSSFDHALAACLFDGRVYVTGRTWSSDFPTTPGAYDRTFGSELSIADAFIAALSLEAGPPGTDAFVLPKRVRVRHRANAEESDLAVAGIFDSGTAAADFTGAATLDVGPAQFTFDDLYANRRGVFRWRGDGADLKIRPSRYGSSRGAFRLKLKGPAASGVDLDAPFTLRFRSGPVDGAGTVALTRGKYRLGKRRGELLAPAVFPYACRARLAESAQDSFTMRIGFASSGTVPLSAPDVVVRLGDAFSQTLAGKEFVRKGDRFVYRSKSGGITNATLDYARERIVVRARKVDVGAFEQGPQPVQLAVRIGSDDELVVGVRMVCKKVTLRY